MALLVFPSSEQGILDSAELLLPPADDPADVPELLDVTEELLLESVDELDFAEEELFVDEDETLSLLPLSEDSFSGDKKLLLSSSPQAVKDIVMANSATKINIVPLRNIEPIDTPYSAKI